MLYYFANSGVRMTSKRTKPKGSADAEGAVSRHQEARQAAKSAKAAKGGRERGSRRAQKAAESEKPDGYEFGRPTDYRPEYAAIARAMCRLGATDFDLAQEFDVKTSTIWRWYSKYPDFCSSTDDGKNAFDNRIERSLAQRAAGYSYHSEKVFQYDGQIVRAEIVEHVPPDVSACRLWLMNRRPDKWRDRQEVKLDGSEAFLKVWQAISDGTASRQL
jgi:hypothetical protein